MIRTVLVTATDYSRNCAAAKKLFEDNGFKVIENDKGRPMTFEELSVIVPDVDAVVAGVDTWDDNVFKLAPRLKIISRFGVGIDNIDVEAATRRSIKVTNAKGGNSNSVAELCIGLIVASMRNIPQLNSSIRRGEWERFVGHDIKSMTVGLAGFGEIARMVAKKLSGFEVNIIAYDKYPNESAAKELGVKFVSFDELLKSSDIVSIHMPSLPETRHTFDEKAFRSMKRSAVLINAARGALVDEKALYNALKGGEIAFAAIDVYEQEPVTKDNPLFSLSNIICTPHTAAETWETYHHVGLVTANAIIDAFNGKRPQNLING